MSILLQGFKQLALVLAVMTFGMLNAVASINIYDTNYHWIDDTGKSVQLKEWNGKKTFLTMAYSECHKICTVTLKKLKEIQTIADKKNQDIQIVVVSIDPQTDTPATWANYRKKHDIAQRKNWHFLSGSKIDTQHLAQHLGIQYWAVEDHIMHDFKIVLLNANGEIDRSIDWDHREVSVFF